MVISQNDISLQPAWSPKGKESLTTATFGSKRGFETIIQNYFNREIYTHRIGFRNYIGEIERDKIGKSSIGSSIIRSTKRVEKRYLDSFLARQSSDSSCSSMDFFREDGFDGYVITIDNSRRDSNRDERART